MMKEIDKKSAVLIHGIFDQTFFKNIKEQNIKSVFVMEARPDFKIAQAAIDGLKREGIKATLISDNMAGFLFKRDYLQSVHVSYSESEDDSVLCPIGALILAVLGKAHKVPVKAHQSSQKIKTMGTSDDITFFNNTRVAPPDVEAYVPLADWVSKKYISSS